MEVEHDDSDYTTATNTRESQHQVLGKQWHSATQKQSFQQLVWTVSFPVSVSKNASY